MATPTVTVLDIPGDFLADLLNGTAVEETPVVEAPKAPAGPASDPEGDRYRELMAVGERCIARGETVLAAVAAIHAVSHAQVPRVAGRMAAARRGE